jgi:hypothetical protein
MNNYKRKGIIHFQNLTSSILIDSTYSPLVISHMQNIYLHPSIRFHSTNISNKFHRKFVKKKIYQDFRSEMGQTIFF